jgi:hypothetical protein
MRGKKFNRDIELVDGVPGAINLTVPSSTQQGSNEIAAPNHFSCPRFFEVGHAADSIDKWGREARAVPS